jgi:hypothetical protein
MQVECTASSTAGNLELSYFGSTDDCMKACSGLPADPGGPAQYSSSPTAVPSSYIGNNVFCRAYHVVAALDQDAPTEHCPHAMGGLRQAVRGRAAPADARELRNMRGCSLTLTARCHNNRALAERSRREYRPEHGPQSGCLG